MAEESRGARQLSARQQARRAAAERAERFEKLAAERRKLAGDVILGLGELDDFAAETERLVAKLQQDRAEKQAAKSATVDALVVQLLDTGVDVAEAAERVGLTQAEVKAAKRRHDAAAKAAAAEAAAPAAAPAEAASATIPEQQDSAPAYGPVSATQPPGEPAAV
ncbi:hypothetical protein ACGF07_32060 [Kitasatospora sp. NPDC048194]|uniref:hypothetical protein n=1 Tax=Kitasatospora sp. NPDC048194 TaxID=3364045 RepID=UPI003724A165